MTLSQDADLLRSLNLERNTHSIIMVLGVGGAGGNAVDHMYDLGIDGVTFMVCNTDKKALSHSPVPIKVQLGTGLGAGNDPERGRRAALESLDDIMQRFEQEGTKMVFVTAGMGGGTGTGAAPVIAKAAKDRNILTVGIVTLPFVNEGPKRVKQAQRGLDELRKHVDSLVVIHNENIKKIYGDLPLTDAFHMADDILARAAKGIAEIVTSDGKVIVDFADVSTVMRDSGISLMGTATAEGEDRARTAIEAALSSPLLNHRNILGARNILLSISYENKEITMSESGEILTNIQDRVRGGKSAEESDGANIIWGSRRKPGLGDGIELTIIVTGFDSLDEPGQEDQQPGRPSARTGAGRQQPIIATPHPERYRQIASLLDIPAYITRKVKLDNLLEANKAHKVAIFKDKEVEKTQPDTPETPPEQDNGTLF